MSARSLPRAALARNTASTSLEALGFDGLCALCRSSSGVHAPDPVVATDPRGAPPIIYSEARASRLKPQGCVVCDSETCPAADVVELPGGDAAWLTPNFYPITFPFEQGPFEDGRPGARGVHLVQWSSLRHDGGLPGADAATAAALLAQLARAEEWLLHNAGPDYPASGDGHRGHVGVIKNCGRRVGGSVEHDHQQILLSSVPFAEPPLTPGLKRALLDDHSRRRTVDYLEGGALTLVPSFMRRPLHAFIVPAGGEVGWLHHLDDAVRDAVALATARLTRAVSAAMTAAGQDPAWNLVVHNGPGCGPLLELRPFTQPFGGYEHIGLYLCEERPETSAARLREALAAG